ncbi:T-cell surface glycoprotein CD5 [Triplophysa rosa]|uniref:T-cell surface glycoprotein CD5 n=1 Tax=Triplophysa rosa TaxID=992332 RepID=A0A9W7WZW8_TRIRA|nr:T-cell surface glycoprotein CD5 [Triplophysa rosa]XP_057188361.1 T-cell surface glycoprotein CD5 [Triplophysa rosa]KAI7811111.1 putative T-cell surface glycoprotein CD5 [Triplophysa rosa]
MENSLLTTLTALLLISIQKGITSSENLTSTTQINIISNTRVPCFTPTPCQNITRNITLPPVLARVKISWKEGSQCAGQLYLSSSDLREVPLCNTPEVLKWSSELCKDTRCGDFENFKVTSEDVKGYFINSNMTVSKASCRGLHVICQDPLGKELAAYKAVTGILVFLILSVILLRFSRPTYKAIRKRFSQKRQNQWIGPTQTQSVSYHRGQAGSQANNNTVKRQSYPGLEKLTVNQSREPSSNRNSDYDSYGCN